MKKVEKKMRTGNVRKYVKSMLTKYLGVFIILIGVLVYNLGSIIVWHGLAIAGLLLSALGFYVGIGQLLNTEFTLKVAMVLNFFLPGLGFAYCREWYFVLGGGALFIATLHPQFPCSTIPSAIGLAIINPSILTLQQIISGICFTSAVLILTYFSAKVHERTRNGGDR